MGLRAKIITMLWLLLVSVDASAFVVDTATPADAAAGSYIVVLDPGHGGSDSGAVGPGGVEEKTLTLEVARRLADTLKDRLGCVVLLTRTRDVSLGLAERTAFANARGADVFISIHVNAARSKKVSGVETYFLSFDATDEEAMRVAEFENRVPALESTAYGSAANDLDKILSDMIMTESHHESSRLAELVHKAAVEATGKTNRGVKQAPFIVLNGAAMPAILVELGFISNPATEKDLSTTNVQTRIADSITNAVAGFTDIRAAGKDYIGFNRRAKKD